MNLIQSLNNYIARLAERTWYQPGNALSLILLPLALIFQSIVTFRRYLYEHNILKRHQFDTPVIVVGNIITGGTGKTPLVIALANYLTEHNLKVGIISRGYMGRASYPHQVSADDSPRVTGDEPLLIKQATQADVVLDPNRVRGIQYLMDTFKPDVIICDDGLQHYALKPGLTIVLHPSNPSIVPYCLPAGPLREPLSRLKDFDMVLDGLSLKPSLSTQPERTLTAVTAIAKPARFQKTLKDLGITCDMKTFRDHHAFTEDDFVNIDTDIIMTEKDWVKCKDLKIRQPVRVVKVAVEFPQNLKQTVNQYLGLSS